MPCVFCGQPLPPGAPQCPRCGGAVPPEPPQAFFGLDATREPPTSKEFGSPYGVMTSASAAAPPAGAMPGAPPASQDPEENLYTALVQAHDRQEVIETKLVEVSAAPPPVAAERKGLPDSRVARGVEDSILEIKRLFYRLGRVGRFAFFGHVLVVLGAVSPWFFVPHQGFVPGIEGWGGIPVALSLAAMGLLCWRFRATPVHRVLPVMLHLLLAACLVLVVLWRYQETREISAHLRPHLAFGFYASALGAAAAFLGSLLGLKDVR
jgi:hypothetical protein